MRVFFSLDEKNSIIDELGENLILTDLICLTQGIHFKKIKPEVCSTLDITGFITIYVTYFSWN